MFNIANWIKPAYILSAICVGAGLLQLFTGGTKLAIKLIIAGITLFIITRILSEQMRHQK